MYEKCFYIRLVLSLHFFQNCEVTYGNSFLYYVYLQLPDYKICLAYECCRSSVGK